MLDQHLRPGGQRLISGLQPATHPAISGPAIRIFLRRRRLAIIAPIAAALGAAYVYMQFAPSTYTAVAQLLIESRLPQFIPGRNADSVLAWDSSQVESEIAVLQSEHIARRVVAKLGLDRAQDFHAQPSLLSALMAKFGERGASNKVEPDRFRDAISVIDRGLNVRRAGLSYAINVTFSFSEPQRAQQIANAISDEYIADQLESKSQAARLGGDWLQQRMVSLRSQMNAASRAVSSFRASHNYDIPKVVDKTERGGDEIEGQVVAPTTVVTEKTTLDELEAAYVMYRRVYESFLQSFTESVQRQSFPVPDAHFLAEANLPLTRSSPRGMLIYPLALLIGCLAGFGLAVGLHQMDRTVRFSGQIAERIGIDSLGVLPRLRSGLGVALLRLLSRLSSPRRGGSASRSRILRQRLVDRPRQWGLRNPRFFTAVLDPRQKAFRSGMLSLKVGLDLASSDDGLGCVGVVTSHRNEGGSMVASNLGTLSAELGMKTLVIDANIERCVLTQHLRLFGNAGLAEILTGAATLDQAAVPIADTLLDVLPAMGQRSEADSTVLFETKALGELLRQASAKYETVVVDLPPCNPITSALELTPLLDGVMIVAREGRTTTQSVADLVEQLSRARAKILGFALVNNAG